MTALESRPAAAPAGGVAAALAGLAEEAFGAALPVRLRAWDGSEHGPAGAPAVVLRSPRALRRLLRHPGELGLAQAYVTGGLDVEGDLAEGLRRVWSAVREAGGSAPGAADLARLAPRALAVLARAGGLGPVPAPPRSQARLRGRLHARTRDRAAIAHHYDLSNAFYSTILDPALSYSCGYWTSSTPGYGLEQAQRDKFDLVCRKLGLDELGPGARLLDVGCGWGSLSIHAAREYGAVVTGVTISAQQAEFARERAERAGVADRVEIRLQDYRDLLDAPYDAVASLEMGEHVGERNYPAYAETLHRQVRPGGRVLVQQMSRGTAGRADRHPGGGPFIEAFIAPDMHMRPVGETVALIERAGLEVRDVHALREHYVRTVAAWYETFERRRAEAEELVGEEVVRVWRLYLVGGGLAFEQGRMGVDQILAVRPEPGGVSRMPAVRVR